MAAIFGKDSVAELMARRSYAKAIELIRAQLKQGRGDVRLRLQLADCLILSGRGKDAVGILLELADEYAVEGFSAKAIAVLKKVQKIEPERGDVADRLARLIKKDKDLGHTPTLTFRGPVFGMEEIRDEVEIGLEPPQTGDKPAPPAPAPPVEAAAVTPAEPEEEPPVDTPLFQGMSREELVAVIGGLQLATYEPGDVIVSQGEPGDSLFVLTTGTVKAWVKSPEGRSVLVRVMRDGDFFGEVSVLSGRARTASVTAASACEMLVLDRATLDRITESHPHVRQVLEEFYIQRAAGGS